MNIGSLTIEMAANVARLQADMAKATGTVQAATAKMQAAAQAATRALAGIGVGLSVAGLASFVKGAIDAADETSKLAQKIGVTTKEVAGLQLAFRQSGIAPDALTSSMARLSKGISEGSDGLKALGINTRNTDGSLKSSRQVLGEVANQFAKYADGAGKTARAVELFGKSGAELIPLLNGGADALEEFDRLADKLGLTIEKSTAQQAELFNDTLDLIGQGVQGVARKVAAQLLPTLTGLASEFFNNVTSGDKLTKTAEFLSSGLKILYIAGLSVVEVFSSVGKVLGAVAGAIVAAAKGDFSEAKTILTDMAGDVKAGITDTAAQIKRAWETTGDSTVVALAKGKKAQMEAAEALEKQKKAAEEYAKFQERIAGKLAELNGVSADYVKQLEEIQRARKAGLVTEAQYVALIEQLIAKQPSSVKLTKEQADAIKQVADAEADGLKVYKEQIDELQKGVQTQRDRVTALETEAEAERLATSLNISLAQAVELVNIAKLEAERINKTDPAVLRALEDEIAARRRILELTANGEARKANADAAKAAAEDWKRFTQDLERGLTDSLFRAFESGKGFFKTLWDGIRNLFKTTVLKAIIQPVVGGITGALGLTSAANAATTGGGIGNLLNLGSNLSTAYSALTGSFITSIGSAATAAGNLFGSTAIAEFGLGLQGLALPSSTGALAAGGSTASALSSAAAAGPYVLAAVAALNALGVFRSRKIVDGGLQGTLGGQVNDYALERRGGTLFNGPSYRVLDRGASAQNDELQKAYSAIRDTVAGMAEQLGIGNDAIKAFTVQLGNDLIHPDTGGFGIKTQGLSQEEIIKKIEAALVGANEQLAAFALGTTQYSREGETAVQTLSRLNQSLTGVNGVFDNLGLSLVDVSLAGADAASKFVELFGGIEQFAAASNSYYQNFFTEAERTANTVQALTAEFASLGLELPTTREGFRELVEAQSELGNASLPTVARLLQLSETFAAVVPPTEALTEVASELATTVTEVVQEFQTALVSLGPNPFTPTVDGFQALLAQMNADIAAANAQIAGTVSNTYQEAINAIQQRAADLRAQLEPGYAADLQNQLDQATYGRSLAEANLRYLQSVGDEVNQVFQQDRIANFTAEIERLTAAMRAGPEVQAFIDSQIALLNFQNGQQATTLITGLNDAVADLGRTDAERRIAGIAKQYDDYIKQLTDLNQLTPANIAAVEAWKAAMLAAADAGITAAEDVQRAAQAILSERLGLENRLLQLQGNTVELRRRELEALDPSNRALLGQIFALEDQAAAAAEAARVQQEAAQAQQEAARAAAQAQADIESSLRGMFEYGQRISQEINALRQRAAADVVNARGGVASALDNLGAASQAAAQRLADAQQAAADELRESMRSVADSVGSYLRELASTSAGSANIFQRREFNGSQFQDLAARALAGDTTAGAQVTDAARAYIESLRETSTSTLEFAREELRIRAQLAQIQDLNAIATDDQTDSLTELQRAEVEALKASQDYAAAVTAAAAAGVEYTETVRTSTSDFSDALAAFIEAQRVAQAVQAELASADQTLVEQYAGLTTELEDFQARTGNLLDGFNGRVDTLGDLLTQYTNALAVINNVQTAVAGPQTPTNATPGAAGGSGLPSVNISENEDLLRLFDIGLGQDNAARAASGRFGGFAGGLSESNFDFAVSAGELGVNSLQTLAGNLPSFIAGVKSLGLELSQLNQVNIGQIVSDIALLNNIRSADYELSRSELALRDEALARYGIQGFANGGFYPGGMALVGERGPELINFSNPGQVYTADQTRSLMGGDTSRMEAQMARMTDELMTLRRELQDIKTNTGDTKTILRRVTQDGDAITTVAA